MADDDEVAAVEPGTPQEEKLEGRSSRKSTIVGPYQRADRGWIRWSPWKSERRSMAKGVIGERPPTLSPTEEERRTSMPDEYYPHLPDQIFGIPGECRSRCTRSLNTAQGLMGSVMSRITSAGEPAAEDPTSSGSSGIKFVSDVARMRAHLKDVRAPAPLYRAPRPSHRRPPPSTPHEPPSPGPAPRFPHPPPPPLPNTQLKRASMYVVSPDNQYRQLWDVVMSLAIVFTAIFVPFEVRHVPVSQCTK